MKVPAVVGALVISAVYGHEAFARRWTDSSGEYSVEAKLIAIRDDSVCLKKENGKTIIVPLEKLSEPDRAFVKSDVCIVGELKLCRTKPSEHAPKTADAYLCVYTDGDRVLSLAVPAGTDKRSLMILVDNEESVSNAAKEGVAGDLRMKRVKTTNNSDAYLIEVADNEKYKTWRLAGVPAKTAVYIEVYKD